MRLTLEDFEEVPTTKEEREMHRKYNKDIPSFWDCFKLWLFPKQSKTLMEGKTNSVAWEMTKAKLNIMEGEPLTKLEREMIEPTYLEMFKIVKDGSTKKQ